MAINKENKDTRINIKLTTELKSKFEEYCVNEGTTISDEIRRYITQCVKTTKQNK